MIFSSQLGKLDGLSDEQALKSISNHLRRMQEELEYRLAHLDSSNISEINADETNVFAQGKDINNIISDQEGRMSQFQQTVEGFEMTVSEYGESVSRYEQTVEGFRTTVDNYKNKVSEYEQTVEGFTTKVTDYEKGYSTWTQTVEGFTQTVKDYENKVSEYEQTVDGFTTKVTDYEKGVSQYKQTVEGFTTQVSNYEKQYSLWEQTVEGFTQQVSDYEKGYSTWTQTVEGFNQTVKDYEEGYSSWEQTVEGFTQQVSDYEKGYSTWTQTVEGFNQTVKDYEEGYSSWEQTVEGFTQQVSDYETALSTTLKMDAKGVYIVDQDGNTVAIHGGQIDTDSIYADALHLGGLLAVYDGSRSDTIGGYLGYDDGFASASGIGMRAYKNGSGPQCVCTDEAARISYTAYAGNNIAYQTGVICGAYTLTLDAYEDIQMRFGSSQTVVVGFTKDGIYPASKFATCGSEENPWLDVYAAGTSFSGLVARVKALEDAAKGE